MASIWPLMICADPGARAHFVASWLLGQLRASSYDVGSNISCEFTKYHTDWGNETAKNFIGRKIRIRTSENQQALALHSYLFLTKNVYPQIPEFPRHGFDFVTTNKILETLKDWRWHNSQIDYSCYDTVVDFQDTYCFDFMINLYQLYNNRYPDKIEIENFEKTNELNRPMIDANHSCSIATLIFCKERDLGLKEIDRFWSLENIYQITDRSCLYDTVNAVIKDSNYGVSNLHGIGVNERTRNEIF